MAKEDVFSYLKEYGEVSFLQEGVNAVDQLLLNELCYLPLTGLVSPEFSRASAKSLASLSDQVQERQVLWDQNPGLATTKRRDLFQLMSELSRYKDLHFLGYREEVSVVTERQFAAVVLTIPEISYSQVVFRGTDTSLIGWKEDFMMTYRSEIPAQEMAQAYLKEVLANWSTDLVVTGHSKGGNLALYASLQQDSEAADKLLALVTYDAPGLHPRILAKDSANPMLSRLTAYRPQESLVGVMLEMPEQTKTIQSRGQLLMQHSIFNWQVSETALVPAVKGQTLLSQTMERVFDQFLDALPNAQLKLCVDTVFDSLILAGVADLTDFQSSFMTSSRRALEGLTGIPAEKRRAVLDALATLMSLIFQEGVKQVGEKAKNKWDVREDIKKRLEAFRWDGKSD
ncbi:Mbeg1-like protein [Streptococcus sp. DD12]|uniref:Mbeg1-like protein n=1 Tax=Streptococcus sp. DD12 TaxID=1777880 RepID=UPI000799FE4F|nr:Mbeg1-like protein [Streptococcus sp. DD12]KXT75776.1 hypothetical protein STRDD12_00888 [Streptococcus sp. DD12]